MPPRTFDWDAAATLYWQGVTVRKIAEQFGVSPTAVRHAVVPGEMDRNAAMHARRQARLAACDRCGGPMKKSSRRKGSTLCMSCAADNRKTAIREGELKCWRCQVWKPDEAFHRSTRSVARRGRTSLCRECARVIARERRMGL